MTTYRYIFRARNPEQGIQFVAVEHDQADDTDGAFSKVATHFRMRHREFIALFGIQIVDDAGKVEWKPVGEGSKLVGWAHTSDPTPRPEHVDCSTKIKWPDGMEATFIGQKSGIANLPNCMYAADAKVTIEYADGFYKISDGSSVSRIDAKLMYWTRVIDVQPTDLFIDRHGLAHMVHSVDFKMGEMGEKFKAEIMMVDGRSWPFIDEAYEPVRIIRTVPTMNNATQYRYAPVADRADRAELYGYRLIGEGMAHDIVSMDRPRLGQVELTMKNSLGQKYSETFSTASQLVFLVPKAI